VYTLIKIRVEGNPGLPLGSFKKVLILLLKNVKKIVSISIDFED